MERKYADKGDLWSSANNAIIQHSESMLFILFHELPELLAVFVDKRFDLKFW